jgi:hypothetical protein
MISVEVRKQVKLLFKVRLSASHAKDVGAKVVGDKVVETYGQVKSQPGNVLALQLEAVVR